MKHATTTALLAFVLCLGPSCAHDRHAARDGDTAPTKLLLVRHAEKARDGRVDPPLTEAGRQRARALIEALENERVDAIYATPFRRTRATARPLAEARGLRIRERATQDAAFVHQLRDRHPGETVLVIGHRTTVPRMLNALSKRERYERLAADAYGQLFVVTLRPESPARVRVTRFGRHAAEAKAR